MIPGGCHPVYAPCRIRSYSLGWRMDEQGGRQLGRIEAMRAIEQLRDDFALYVNEIDRCLETKCHWALLHILLSLPDVCAELEAVPGAEVGDRYVGWCSEHLPASSTLSGADRYQMRNSLLHAGSTTVRNLGKKHQSGYMHFSYIDPDGFDVSVHNTTSPDRTILNVHVIQMAAETKQALENWFLALQSDSARLSRVEQSLGRLARRQPKRVLITDSTGQQVERPGWTRSSTGLT